MFGDTIKAVESASFISIPSAAKAYKLAEENESYLILNTNNNDYYLQIIGTNITSFSIAFGDVPSANNKLDTWLVSFNVKNNHFALTDGYLEGTSFKTDGEENKVTAGNLDY